MDASKVIELHRVQANRYINRAKTVDSSLQTWRNQIQSSRFISDTLVRTPPNADPCTNPTNFNQVIGCRCSSEANMPGSGSATTVYSVEKILLQAAGNAECASRPLNLTEAQAPGYKEELARIFSTTASQISDDLVAKASQYIILPECSCSNSNAGTVSAMNPNAMNPPEHGYNLYLPFPEVRAPIPNHGTTITGLSGGQQAVPCVYGTGRYVAPKYVDGYMCCGTCSCPIAQTATPCSCHPVSEP